MDFTAHYESPLGGITLGSNGIQLFGLWFDGQAHFGECLHPPYEESRTLQVFDTTRLWLDLYFNGQVPDFTPPLELRASAFRRRVWEILLTIPYGHTTTYGDIARQIAHEQGLPSFSSQAVGRAVSHNSISLIIPCHRVIGANGSLTGYAGGLERKTQLLRMEGAW